MMLRELPPQVLARRALVYVRQSTGMQVQEKISRASDVSTPWRILPVNTDSVMCPS